MIWIKNGGYIPYLYFVFLYLLNGDKLFATALTIRLFTINYFFCFFDWNVQSQVRQFVRFTDSQTLVCLLNWYYKTPIIEELTHNILMLVTVGFWIAKTMEIDETLISSEYPFLQQEVCKLYHYINHGLLLLLFTSSTNITNNMNSYKNTLLFILFYIMLIYIPWYFITDDTIYNIPLVVF